MQVGSIWSEILDYIYREKHIRNNFFTKRVVRNRLTREVVESLSLDVFRGHVSVTQRDTVNGGLGCARLVARPDLKGLFQPK